MTTDTSKSSSAHSFVAGSNPWLQRRVLGKEIESQAQKLSWTNQQIMSLKMMKSKQELENCKLEDELRLVSIELDVYMEQLEELQKHRDESLKALESSYELREKEKRIEYDEKLAKLKEQHGELIDKAISDAKESLRKDRDALKAEVKALSPQIQAHTTEMNRNLIKLKEDHHKKILQLHSTMDEIRAEVKRKAVEIERELIQKQKDVALLKSSLSGPMNEVNAELHGRLAQLKEQLGDKENSIHSLEAKVTSTEDKIQSIKASFSSKIEEIEYYQVTSKDLRREFPLLEQQRRKLHNRLQELKGNIRVFCRIRPVSSSEPIAAIESSEGEEFNQNCKQDLAISKDDSGAQSSYNLGGSSKPSIQNFQFDKIFNQKSTNQHIFTELSQLIQSSLDGYNVCVFAYGQTGSGKTWTMSHEEDGMIPLSINKIFADISDLEKEGWQYQVVGQFVEIYNENILDLLSTTSTSAKHEIKHDDSKKLTTVTNVTTVSMKSREDALQVLKRATKKRSTASTVANERSSRSHSVFVLRIAGENQKLGKKSTGTLNLIDLAGSERLSSSQAKGDRLKETQAINKSLSCLGDVIHSLAQQQSTGQATHIPYRNSKLTYLLKHSLGGDSKTLMFVNILPLAKNFGETINSLRFATKVNNTKLN